MNRGTSHKNIENSPADSAFHSSGETSSLFSPSSTASFTSNSSTSTCPRTTREHNAVDSDYGSPVYRPTRHNKAAKKANLKRKLVFHLENEENRPLSSSYPERTEVQNNLINSTAKSASSTKCGSAPRKVIPLSERQQLALVLQLTASESAAASSNVSEISGNPKNVNSGCQHQVTKQRRDSRWYRLNKRNERGETPLHVAAIRGDLLKVKKLIQEGADVNSVDFAGWTPLHEACNHGWLEIVELLINAGADVDACGLDNVTPLHDAAVNGHSDLVRLLLEHGADPSRRNARWKTPVDVVRDKEVLTEFQKFFESTNHILHGNSGFHKTPPFEGDSQGGHLLLSCASSGVATMRKNSPQAQSNKGAEKPTSPRLTLRIQTIRSRDEKHVGGSKSNDVTSTQPKYQSYCVTMESRGDVYDFKKEDMTVTSTRNSSGADSEDHHHHQGGDSKGGDAAAAAVTSSSSSSGGNNGAGGGNKDAAVAAENSASKDGKKAAPEPMDSQPSVPEKTDPSESSAAGGGVSSGITSAKVNGGRGGVSDSVDVDYASDSEREDGRRKRRKSSDNNVSSGKSTSSSQRTHRNPASSKSSNSQDGHSDHRSPKATKKRGSVSSSDTESVQSDGDHEAEGRTTPQEPSSSSSTAAANRSNNNNNGSPGSAPHSPKVPPLKIVIPTGLEPETRERSKVSSSKQALPYVVNTAADPIVDSGGSSEASNSMPQLEPATSCSGKVESSAASSSNSSRLKDDSHPSEERCHRVTRSSQRMQAVLANNNSGGGGNNSAANSGGNSNSNNSTSSSHNHNSEGGGSQKEQSGGDSSADEPHHPPLDVHPRKRKLRPKETAESSSGSASSSSSMLQPSSSSAASCGGAGGDETQQTNLLNSYQMFMNIRKQVDKKRKSMFVVHPKPPQGFKDYLLNRCSYVLQGNSASRICVPMIPPPQSLTGNMRELFVQQEKERYKLRLQHLIEREKLVLSAEQEILRVHGRAARALANQTVPLSVCSILKDEEIYNVLEHEQEDKDKNVRSRYNGRLFLSWLQDVDDKWEKIKEAMLLRHHNEAESLHAVQRLNWEWKLKELGACDTKSTPVIDDICVPMVHVSDDFDLLPA